MTTSVFNNTSVFESETQAPDQGLETQTDVKTVYIGEGRKYKTVEDADKAFGHLNSHVERIERENRELREKNAKAKTVEEVLETIKQQSTRATGYTGDITTPPAESRQEVDLNAVIADKLLSWEQQQIHKQNAQTVEKELIGRFGEKAPEVFKAKSKELGIDLNSLALQSPKAVLEFFPKQATPPGDLPSTINTSYYDNNQPKIGTKTYWNDQFKTGKISREDKFRREHESLESMGWEAFNK